MLRLHECWAQQENQLFWQSGDSVSSFPSQQTELTHIECTVDQHFQTLFCRLLSSYSSPLNLFSELLQTGCRIWHVILLNLIPLFIGHYHNLSRTLCKMLLSGRIKSSFHLVSSTKLPVLHSTSASRLLVNILNRAGPRTEPWGIPLMISLQTDVAPDSTTLWALPFS